MPTRTMITKPGKGEVSEPHNFISDYFGRY